MTDRAKTRALRDQFFRQQDKNELRQTAIDIERHGDRSAVPWLIKALHDENPHRRHAAARALGWIPKAGPRAAKALVGVLQDQSQAQPVREEAAESLAYLDYAPAIPTLISVLTEGRRDSILGCFCPRQHRPMAEMHEASRQSKIDPGFRTNAPG